jgi:hypothetical protein
LRGRAKTTGARLRATSSSLERVFPVRLCSSGRARLRRDLLTMNRVRKKRRREVVGEVLEVLTPRRKGRQLERERGV